MCILRKQNGLFYIVLFKRVILNKRVPLLAAPGLPGGRRRLGAAAFTTIHKYYLMRTKSNEV